MGKSKDKQELRTKIAPGSIHKLDKWCNRKNVNRGVMIQMMIDFFDQEYEACMTFRRRIQTGRIILKQPNDEEPMDQSHIDQVVENILLRMVGTAGSSKTVLEQLMNRKKIN